MPRCSSKIVSWPVSQPCGWRDMTHLIGCYIILGVALLLALDSLAYHRFRRTSWLDVVVVVLWPIAAIVAVVATPILGLTALWDYSAKGTAQ